MDRSYWDFELSPFLEKLESIQAGPGASKAGSPYSGTWFIPVLMFLSFPPRRMRWPDLPGTLFSGPHIRGTSTLG